MLIYTEGCMYGDRATVCTKDLCRNEVNWFVCCETCQQFISSTLSQSSSSSTTNLGIPPSTPSPSTSSISTIELHSTSLSSSSIKTTRSATATAAVTTTESALITTEPMVPNAGTLTTTTESKTVRTKFTRTTKELTTESVMTTADTTTDVPPTTEIIIETTERRTLTPSATRILNFTSKFTETTIKDTKSTETTTHSDAIVITTDIFYTKKISNVTSEPGSTVVSPTGCTDSFVNGSACADFININGVDGCYIYDNICCQTCSSLSDRKNPGNE